MSVSRSRTRLLSTTGEAENLQVKKIDIPIIDNADIRATLISRIENVALNIIQQICSGQLPRVSCTVSCKYTFTKPDVNDEIDETQYCQTAESSSFNYEDFISESIDETANRSERNSKVIVSDFGSKNGKNKFALMITVMANAHRLLLTNSTVTRRSFYYDLKVEKTINLAPNQRHVDEAVNRVSNLLNCAPWELNFTASSKGLVAGDLSLTLINNRIIDCTVPGGAAIPQIISNVISIRAKARFVLIVEKDAIFQKLLEENCNVYFNCILVTGKGYPDIATRMLVKLLSDKMELPVYIIVDANPFGMDIMCVYRFGSATLSKENKSLACSKVRWLGIFPSELLALGVKTLPLTKRDLWKLTAIECRPYMTDALLKELRIMRKGKAEIEGISSFSKNFLMTTYLSCKIKGEDFI